MTHIASAETTKTTAILDLKSAYDIVPRDLLSSVLKKVLNGKMASLVVLSIQPVSIKTQVDETEKTVPNDKGCLLRVTIKPHPIQHLHVHLYQRD